MKLQAARESTVAAVSLGCDKNRIDTEVVLGKLLRSGYRFTQDLSAAGIIFVNTCAFIEEAQQESINTILKLARGRRGRLPLLIAGGCLSERYGRELLDAVPELDGVIGLHSYQGLVEFLKRCRSGHRAVLVEPYTAAPDYINPRLLTTAPHSVYVKIAEGCSNRCCYCLIPSLRGPFRSRPVEHIRDEMAGLVEQGAREINLIAQDTTAYGSDQERLPDLAGLLQTLLKIEGRFWLRLLYAHPSRLSGDLVALIAREPRLCSYLDLPLQHVNSRILRRMGRFYSTGELLFLIDRLRREIPGLALRTTYMTGFPGESGKEFRELLSFVEEHPFERVGVFAYSRQAGTRAAELPDQVPRRVREKRRHALLQAQQAVSLKLQQKLVGTRVTVLAEGRSKNNPLLYWGRTEQQAPGVDGRIYFRAARPVAPGSWLSMRISAVSPYDLLGTEARLI